MLHSSSLIHVFFHYSVALFHYLPRHRGVFQYLASRGTVVSSNTSPPKAPWCLPIPHLLRHRGVFHYLTSRGTVVSSTILTPEALSSPPEAPWCLPLSHSPASRLVALVYTMFNTAYTKTKEISYLAVWYV